jgi:putative inorganic carbon (HCO3(-)) transporter
MQSTAPDTARSWTDVVSGLLLAAWFLYLLLSPTVGFGWIDSWHNEQRAAQVVLLVATAVGFCAMVLHAPFRRRLPDLHWIVVVVFALGAVSAARARYVDAAFTELALHFLLLILIMVTAAAVARQPARALRLAQYGSLLLLWACLAGVAMHYAAAVSIRHAIDVDVVLLGYANARMPSALHALLIPFVATLSTDPRQMRTLRLLGFAALAGTWAINLALGTRAIWFAYVVSLAIIAVAVGWQRLRPLVQVMILSAIAGAVLYEVIFRLLPVWIGLGESFEKRTLDQLFSGSNRELLIRSSLQAIGSAPLLGIGPMQFAAIPKVWAAHPHNWVLQLASEWGLPAALLAIVGTIGLFRQFVSQLRTETATAEPEGLLTAFLCSTVALVYGLVDGSLVMPVSQSAAAMGFGAWLGTMRASGSTARTGSGGWRTASLLALLSAAAAVHLGSFTVRTEEPATALERGEHFLTTHALWPRYWSEGFLPLRGSPPSSRWGGQRTTDQAGAIARSGAHRDHAGRAAAPGDRWGPGDRSAPGRDTRCQRDRAVAERSTPGNGESATGVSGRHAGDCRKRIAARQEARGDQIGDAVTGARSDRASVVLHAFAHRVLDRADRLPDVGPTRSRHIRLVLRDSDRREDADDRHDDHQFDQRETALRTSGKTLHDQTLLRASLPNVGKEFINRMATCHQPVFLQDLCHP